MNERYERQQKIYKLLVKATHPGTPEAEAASCHEMAKKLCEKYGFVYEVELSLVTEPKKSTPPPSMNYCKEFGCRLAAPAGFDGYCMSHWFRRGDERAQAFRKAMWEARQGAQERQHLAQELHSRIHTRRSGEVP